MKSVSLQAEKRDILGKKTAELRAKGLLPAVLYGQAESVSISVPFALFEKAYKQAGASTLVDLSVDGGAAVKTLIHDVQVDPVTDRTIHVDFYQVKMTEKLTATIPLKFIGEPKAVKELGGTLVKNIDEVEVRCLPGDLVSDIEVDLASLKTFEDSITVQNLNVPRGIEVLAQGDAIIATVTASLSEEDVKKLEEQGAAGDISTVAKVEEKKEGDETAKE